MFWLSRYIIVCSLLLLAARMPAQNLTGTWEGDLGNDQFLQLNILQTGNKICGYTSDHVKKDTNSFCKAFFEGYFDTKKNRLVINGKYFLKNSGSHILMHLKLKLKSKAGNEFLENQPFMTIRYREFRSIFGITVEPYIDYDSSEYVYIKKVADQPREINELMQDCIAADRKKDDTGYVKIKPKPADSLPPIVQIPLPEKKNDSLPEVVKIEPGKTDSISVLPAPAQRKNVEQSHITVDVKHITLKVYDNAVVDGDTVSILYNGKMLLAHQLLSEKGIELNIELDEEHPRHEITLFAENLGSIPPNTALVVVTAGKKRYELFASASLEANAVLVFDYKPPGQ